MIVNIVDRNGRLLLLGPLDLAPQLFLTSGIFGAKYVAVQNVGLTRTTQYLLDDLAAKSTLDGLWFSRSH